MLEETLNKHFPKREAGAGVKSGGIGVKSGETGGKPGALVKAGGGVGGGSQRVHDWVKTRSKVISAQEGRRGRQVQSADPGALMYLPLGGAGNIR